MTRNIELQTADTLIVEARAVDLCGQVGFRRRHFRSQDFVRGKTGWLGTLDKRARLEIPGDAISSEGIALSEDLPWSDDSRGERPLLGPYRFDLSQIRPVGAMDLTFSVGGMGFDRENFSKLAVYRWQGGRWEHIESTYDPGRETVRAAVFSGGVYTLLFSESVTSEEVLPRRFALYPNTPNPFNPTTAILFDLPERADVSLKVFDVRGRRVRVLEDAPLAAGRYNYAWDGRDSHGRRVASGIYFYRLVAGENTATRKMTLIR
jgi:hypothetical protein